MGGASRLSVAALLLALTDVYLNDALGFPHLLPINSAISPPPHFPTRSRIASATASRTQTVSNSEARVCGTRAGRAITKG
jgi:hypothetical protein